MLKGLIRISAFWFKEMAEILRQPRLLLSLILGPFLILLLFGIGYQANPRNLRTKFVVPPNSNLQPIIEDYAKTLGQQLIYAGTTTDQKAALDELARHQVDLVVVMPADSAKTIRNGRQAVVKLYHNEIDPTQINYVKYFGELYIQEVNRRILATVTGRGQTQAAQAHDDLQRARQSLNGMEDALRAGDRARARTQAADLQKNVRQARTDLSAQDRLLGGLALALGAQSDANDPSDVASSLDTADNQTSQLQQQIDSPNADMTAMAKNLSTLDSQLARTDQLLTEFQSVPAGVLVSPFTTEAQDIAPYQPTFVAFYAPAVLALLLQHMAVTIAALSLVRERLLGALELFRVSPLSATETLIGKYISFMVFGMITAALLAVLIILGLGVPLLGVPVVFAEALALLLFGSLGLGFLISAVSDSDSQAVQLSMIVLLASMFFSGFILPLNTLLAPARAVSYVLPVTYGIILLQDIMLRGTAFFDIYWLALAALGVIFGLLALVMFRRQFRRA